MDFLTDAPAFADKTTPVFLREAEQLRGLLATYTTDEIGHLMTVSEALAVKTQDMYADTTTKQAFWAYDGDVFKGVQAKTLDEPAAKFAQAHVVVPSGLYGLLRPYDTISPYRLEMKAKVVVGGTKNLYEFWGDKLAKYVDSVADGEVLMLASYEDARTILPYVVPTTRIVTPAFIDRKTNGQEAQVAIYNKMMRGVMARWVIDSRIDSLTDITSFSAHGYSYDASRSTIDKPVFYRPHMSPLRF